MKIIKIRTYISENASNGFHNEPPALFEPTSTNSLSQLRTICLFVIIVKN